MAWQKTKTIYEYRGVDKNGKKIVHRYYKRKSKGGGKNNTEKPSKHKIKKYCPYTNKQEIYVQLKSFK